MKISETLNHALIEELISNLLFWTFSPLRILTSKYRFFFNKASSTWKQKGLIDKLKLINFFYEKNHSFKSRIMLILNPLVKNKINQSSVKDGLNEKTTDTCIFVLQSSSPILNVLSNLSSSCTLWDRRCGFSNAIAKLSIRFSIG